MPASAPGASPWSGRPPGVLSISLVVCTRDRVRALEGLLASVDAAVRPPGFELVLVDNGSRDATAARGAAHEAAASYPVTVLREPRPGLGRARNRGWQAADGEVVAFTDDDCRLAPDALVELAAVLASWPVDVVGGAVLAPPGVDQARVALAESPWPELLPAASTPPPGLLQGANLAFRRVVLERVGGFDERLGAGTAFRCEDVECVARALAAGYRAAYVPWVVVEHHHGRSDAQGRRLEAANDVARGAYYASRARAGDRAAAGQWAAAALDRFGWRPASARRALGMAAREVAGALAWAAASAWAGPRPAPAGAPAGPGHAR